MATVDSSSIASEAQELNKDLVTRILALQELVTKQTSQLEELRIDPQLLLEENKLMQEQIIASVLIQVLYAIVEISSMISLHGPITSFQAQMQQSAGMRAAKR